MKKERNLKKRKFKLLERDAAWMEKNQGKMDKYIADQQRIYNTFKPTAISLAVNSFIQKLKTSK